MKNCTKCNSQDTYRKNLQNVTIYCELLCSSKAVHCGYSWESNQIGKPMLSQKAYSTTPPKGTHTIQVWLCPNDPSKYSFSISFGAGVVGFNEFEEDPFLSGCYSTPEEALNAGVIKAMD